MENRLSTFEAGRGNLPIISRESFPLPHRADTFDRPLSPEAIGKLSGRSDFAQAQAAIANEMLKGLSAGPPTLSVEQLVDLYDGLVDWRARLPLADFGNGPPDSQRNLLMPIDDEFPNCDRLGGTARYRANPIWSDEEQIWIGGTPTLASKEMELTRSWALRRFETEAGDILQNMVELPDGQMVKGSLLIRGDTAIEVLEWNKAVEEARREVSQYETGGDPVLAVTGKQADRITILTAALESFSRMEPRDCKPEAWANHAYLLFQSPQFNRGSDAVIRTFLTIVPAHLNGAVPISPQDIDLRATAQSQRDFVQGVIEDTKWL